MILLDTHIWIWWVQGDSCLTKQQQIYLQNQENQGLGISLISCWEVAKLVENQRLTLPCNVDEWLEQALNYPGIYLLDLTIPIMIESTRLPKPFHRDPADQIIVATSRLEKVTLFTRDQKILAYPYVEKVLV